MKPEGGQDASAWPQDRRSGRKNPSTPADGKMPTRADGCRRAGTKARRYAFHSDEVAEAEAQGLPYVLVPRVCSSSREWMERYAEQPPAEASPGDQ
jgi:hypothetical protein